MRTRVTSHAGKLSAWLYDLGKERARRCAVYFAARLKEVLGTPYPPASRAGEAPHRRSGNLQSSVTVVKTAESCSVKVTAAYSSALERGTPVMDARPFVKVTLKKHMDALKRIAGGRQ